MRSRLNKPGLLVLGLGNPGAEYRYTRHNAGFRVLDILSELSEIRLQKKPFKAYELGKGVWRNHTLILVKPLTYMNNSGIIVPSLLRRFVVPLDRMMIVCDTLDLEPGRIRLKRKGGSAGHRGITSVIQAVGSSDFPRMYIGVGRPELTSEVVDFVLGRPDAEDEALIRSAQEAAARGIIELLDNGLEQVMHEINRKQTPRDS
ncbi:MAG: aminoacyl-tRNA hydrolase [Spirochaetales bacterium]|nr:aminoacyl-tRNA hydrolase [Spirochaetales bacterium]